MISGLNKAMMMWKTKGWSPSAPGNKNMFFRPLAVSHFTLRVQKRILFLFVVEKEDEEGGGGGEGEEEGGGEEEEEEEGEGEGQGEGEGE